MFRLQLVESGVEDQTIPAEDLATVFAATAGDGGPTFMWTPDEDSAEAVVVALIDDDWCYVSMLDSVDWSDLWDTEDDENEDARVKVILAGLPAYIPHAAVVPRHVGLGALVSAPTFSRVPSTYVWRRQPR
jgi:hypothetical protein